MRFLDFLALQLPTLRPETAKLHLATWNGNENPLDEYLAGRFNEWQRWQTRRNFGRNFVVSLVALPTLNQWLYAGVHTSLGEPTWHEDGQHYYYTLEVVPAGEEFNGRLVVRFERPGRQSYLNAETWNDRLSLGHLRPERMRVADFPGYRAIDLSFAEVQIIFREGVPSWRSALASVAGIYLISDTFSGKLYVGSATGEGGIWQRWQSYAETGHGGNAELRTLVASKPDYANGFRFSVLETTDVQESTDSVLRREAHWKAILLSRTHGLNAN